MAGKITVLDESSFDDFISSGNCVIDFYADWCVPCKVMAPHFQKASEEMTNVKFAKVDVDSNQDLAGRFQIMSIPTTLFIKDGEQVDRFTGAMRFEDIKERVDSSF